MASSDLRLICLKSSLDVNFAVAASLDDNIAALKKKAEAAYLELYPDNGRIASQAIMIRSEGDGDAFTLSDNLVFRCLFDVGESILLEMDAVQVTVPPDDVQKIEAVPVTDSCSISI